MILPAVISWLVYSYWRLKYVVPIVIASGVIHSESGRKPKQKHAKSINLFLSVMKVTASSENTFPLSVQLYT